MRRSLINFLDATMQEEWFQWEVIERFHGGGDQCTAEKASEAKAQSIKLKSDWLENHS